MNLNLGSELAYTQKKMKIDICIRTEPNKKN
jgi:hypothetical protein